MIMITINSGNLHEPTMRSRFLMAWARQVGPHGWKGRGCSPPQGEIWRGGSGDDQHGSFIDFDQLVGGLEHEFYFSILLGITAPTDELIFFRGVV
jgi:hypothetical protein